MIQIDLGSLEMNTGVPDVNGGTWYVDGLTGWDGANLNLSTTNITQVHGEAILSSLYGSRSIGITGVVKVTGEAAFWTVYNYLTAILADPTTSAQLTVHEGASEKSCTVLRAGPPKIEIGFGSMAFQLSLVAPDPFKYGNSHTQTIAGGATQSITNTGAATAYPVVTLTGAGTVDLRNTTSGGLVKTTAIPSGTVLDFKNRTVKNGSSDYFSTVDPTSTWWGLMTGTNSVQQAGSAGVSVTYYDTYL